MLYNILLFIYFVFSIPKAFYDSIVRKKKKKDLLKRFGLKKYGFNPKNKNPIIWIHAVSVGETKAATSLLEQLKTKHPNSYIIISSTTQTGHQEAKRSLILADKFIFFPFDFSISVKRVFKQIKPDLIIFMETDLWLNFITQAKKNHAKIVIASAKVSKRSAMRFSKFPKFSKKLFSSFDLILTQNELYKSRFTQFTTNKNIHILGNLKLVNTIKRHEEKYLDSIKQKINPKNSHIITIASTHDPEEEFLINALKDIADIKILLAPRHPQRFNAVYKQIKKITPCCLYSDIQNQDAKVIIIDQMGILNTLYQISSLAIVGGSFIKTIGGHNILEPVFVNTPVFFGPYMHSQEELKNIILDKKCGKQLEMKNLRTTLVEFLKDQSYKQELINNCHKVTNQYQNILDNTFAKIDSLLKS